MTVRNSKEDLLFTEDREHFMPMTKREEGDFWLLYLLIVLDMMILVGHFQLRNSMIP